MDSFHAMWLFVALLLTFIGNSFCLDCQYSVVPNSRITVSSTLNSSYGKENIIGLSDMPWVGEGTSDWFSLDFQNPILLSKLEMNGGDVNVYGNGTLVKCFVTRFWLYYKDNGQWYKYSPKFRLEDGHDSHNETVDIKYPITSINITIKKYDECPAVNLKLTACGVCTKPNAGKLQNISCTDDLQQCTYKCAPGYVPKTNTDAVKICQLDGSWSGPNLTCDDIDECTKNTTICGDNADCINVAGSYNCNCRTGFTGSGPCKDINECKQSQCHKYANCTNTVGSYDCKCLKGFSGNGFNCTDINECEQSQCHKYANCTNTVGSYECKCRKGFSGNGFNCTDINECEQTQCHKYASCANTLGSYECKCWKGFSGNGFNCAGDKVNTTIIRYTSTTLRYGEKLELHCTAVGLPKPGIEWQTPNNGILSKRILTIERVKMLDGGTYKCIGSNNDTTDTREIEVTVIGTPTVTAIVHTEADANSIRVSWRKPDDEGASKIIDYVVHYMTGGVGKEFETRELSVVIKGLRADTEYFIWVVARNGQGPSLEQSDLNVSTLAPKPETLPQPKKTKTSTSSSANIRVMKLSSQHKTKLQVIVQKVSARKKRNTAGFPNNISNYDNAGCGGTSGCYYITAQLENKDVDFTIGDDKMYDDFKNAKLEPATTYNIYVRGISYNGVKKENVGDPSPPLKISTAAVPANEESGSVIGIAVGLTVLFVVLIVLVLGAIIYIRSRRPKTIEIDPETGEEKGRNSELHLLTKKQHGKRKSGQVEDGQPDPNHPPVPTSGFAKFVGKLHKSDDRGFMIQYNTLETSQTYTSDFATSPDNKDKNRYANIVAYDVSRVHLKQIDDDDNSSYINASFVDGYNSVNAYIATQGPLPETFNDFWRMIWEKNCSSIVMLTNLQERHKLKCHKYWPEESETYGQLIVTATRKEQYADYVIRTFLLMMNETEEEREIKQFHFTVWPDHGVPEYPTAILAFQRRVRAYSTRDSGPLAVHCSAGVGRSGTFIVIDCMLARIQSEQSIDIYNYVRYLRTRRMYMVQTEEQYVFCHDALLESILCGNTQMAAHNLRIEMNRLRQRDATTKLTGFESEFKTLNKVSPSLPKESFVVATYPENASKNRYHDILASDHGRVTLNEDDDKEEGPYINAVYLDGYKQQNAFIVTQTPLKETIKDFWRMLYEKHSACVILLTNLALEEGDFPRFWPEEGSEEYSTFNVEVVSDVSKGDTGSEDQFQQEKLTGDIVERKLKLTKVEDKSLVVKMFQHLSWTETSVPTDISAIISLIQRIEKWQQRSGNGPITIVCNNGQGRSGTFAALCSVLERVKTEQVVDVFQTIKALRIQRPGLVKDVDQYQFIHLGVQEYLDSFADYANFK